MTEPLLLVIDVGTSRAKVGAFYLDGRTAALTVANYPEALHTDGAASEQDPLEWWRHLTGAIRSTLERKDRAAIRGVCVG